MSSGIVSIITPSFNRADIVHETADSIFRQTYPHWEWVIVDDGSTDNSWEVLQQFAAKDQRVKIFKRDRSPKGACACRNIAVEKSQGQYLVFLDTDDLLAARCLEQRVAEAQKNPDCDFIIFPMLLFKTKPDDLGTLWNVDNTVDEVERLLMGDPICQGTGTIWKKDSFIKGGMWNETLLLWQDIELHLRTFLQPVKYKKRMDLPPDVFLRVSDVSMSRTGYHSLPKLQSRGRVFRGTALTIESQHKLEKYRRGLQNMGSDLVLSAAQSSYFEEADNLLAFCKGKGIFSRKEAKAFASYILARRLKLYKLPFIETSLRKKVRSLIPEADNSLGKIKYTHSIQY